MKSGPVAAGRVRELDGIRAIAIWMVLAAHLQAHLPRSIAVVVEHGWLGVDLFFVLSGYLITSILLNSRERGAASYFGQFYRRRAFRILPLYVIVLAGLAIAYASAVGPSFFFLALAFAANIAALGHVLVPPGGGPLWSLAVEEQFYLVWPVLVFMMSRRGLLITLIAILCIVPALRFVFPTAPLQLTWFRCDGLAMGAILALWASWPQRSRNIDDRVAFGFLCGAVLLFVATAPFGGSDQGRLSSAIRIDEALFAFAALVVFAVSRVGSPHTGWLRFPFALLTADLSYCLYLIHVPITNAYDVIAAHLVPHAFMGEPFIGTVIRAASVLIVAYAVAMVSRRYLEEPLTRLGRGRRPADVAVGSDLVA